MDEYASVIAVYPEQVADIERVHAMTGQPDHRRAILRQRQDERLLWVDRRSGHGMLPAVDIPV
jgi:hypothetical protein